VDAPAGELDEEEDVDSLQRDRLDGEEVDGEHARCLPQESPPRESVAVSGWPEPGLAEDLANCRRRHS
jgi:hypothetical protein